MMLVNEIGNAINLKQYSNISQSANYLKKASRAIGAGNLHFDCFYMEENYNQNQKDKMVSRYNRLIEDTIEL